MDAAGQTSDGVGDEITIVLVDDHPVVRAGLRALIDSHEGCG